jgi:DNA replication and repair protein RecF
VLVHGISLFNYRNYREQQLNFHPSLNIIIGDNAQGKTNILESIYYAVTGKSHRTNYDNEMIRWGESFLRVVLAGERYSGKIKIEIIVRTDGKKILKINNKPKKKLSELIGAINTVLFSPEDMMMVKGSPSVRRRFLDMEISQTSPSYCHNLVSYNKALSQRNNLLKAVREGEENDQLIDIWDTQLVNYGVPIIKKRSEVIGKIKPIAREIHRKITDGKEEINVSYISSVNFKNMDDGVKEEEFFLKKLKENRKMEIIKGVTSLGPHRDDMGLKIGSTDIKSFGSQGQQRTGALSLKLSEIEFIKMETGESPVLLLDDVMSELDEKRRKFLLEVVREKVQTFITSTGVEDIVEKVNGPGRIFEVKEGKTSLLQEG